jgi:uncharacterized damage-inducible protein DinB
MGEPEVWLCGPIVGVIPLLQPVAHSLLQSRRELAEALSGLSPAHLRARPGGAASVEYHARHATGSLDRLATYARGEQLSGAQLGALKAEQEPDGSADLAARLVSHFDATVTRVLQQLRETPEAVLAERREVGRARLPSTVIGLLVHAAEHTQRHVGQLATTAKIVCSTEANLRPPTQP